MMIIMNENDDVDGDGDGDDDNKAAPQVIYTNLHDHIYDTGV